MLYFQTLIIIYQSTAGTKTASGDITVNNDLTTAATTNCKLDMGAYSLILKGDLLVGATSGLDVSDISCVLTLAGTSIQSISYPGAGYFGTTNLLNQQFSSISSGPVTTNVATSIPNGE